MLKMSFKPFLSYRMSFFRAIFILKKPNYLSQNFVLIVSSLNFTDVILMALYNLFFYMFYKLMDVKALSKFRFFL